MRDLRDINGSWTPDEPRGLADSNGSDEDDTFYDYDWFNVVHRIDIMSKLRMFGYLLLMLFSLISLTKLIDQIWSLDPGESAGIVAGISLLVLLVFLYIVNIDVIRTYLADLLLGKVWNEKSPDSTNGEDRIDVGLENESFAEGGFGWMTDFDFF